MNEKEFLKQLVLALEEFCVHERLLDEIRDILKRSGNEKGFLGVLLQRLKFLGEFGVQATQDPNFEQLEQGIYRIRIRSKSHNVRILYGFLSNQQPALLLAFHERAGHNATDYTGKCTVAAARLSELEGDL